MTVYPENCITAYRNMDILRSQVGDAQWDFNRAFVKLEALKVKQNVAEHSTVIYTDDSNNEVAMWHEVIEDGEKVVIIRVYDAFAHFSGKGDHARYAYVCNELVDAKSFRAYLSTGNDQSRKHTQSGSREEIFKIAYEWVGFGRKIAEGTDSRMGLQT
jgi:hypothetical protein